MFQKIRLRCEKKENKESKRGVIGAAAQKTCYFLLFYKEISIFLFFWRRNDSLSVEEKKNVVSNSLNMRLEPEKKVFPQLC